MLRRATIGTMGPKTRRPTTNDEAKKLLNCVRRLVRELRLSDRETQQRYGLTAAQAFVLHALRETEALTVNEIADRTATDQSSVSVVIQRLVQRRLIKRTVNPQDRRSFLLSLTDRGRTLMRRSPLTAQEKIFGSVSKMTLADRRRLAALFEKFLSGMGVRAEGPPPMLFEDGQSPRAARPRRRA